MPERKHYSKAPITEAIIDLRIVQTPGFSLDGLAPLRKILADRYPNQEEEHVQYRRMSFVGSDLLQAGGGQQLNGFRFISKDKRETLSTRLDGFAFIVRAPYARWETFRDEARRLWNVYRSVTEVESITRVALRYINRIDIPSTSAQLEKYLRTYPQVSADMPQEGTISDYFMQLQQWQEDPRCMLIVNEAPVPPPDPGTTSIQLDFDIFREQFVQPWRADQDDAVWEFLEQLHDLKNRVFEASITNKTRELII